MSANYDRSDRDKKYFIDGSVYNCPFCKRRHVSYLITDHGSFNFSNTKRVYYYLVQCADCDKTSFHLSNYKLNMKDYGGYSDKKFVSPFVENQPIQELDDLFFHNLPTSSFTIDSRIPPSIREPLSEADNCLKSNFLTGASGCLRKAIYKLLRHETIPETNNDNKVFLNHNQRIQLLKKKHPEIDSSLFNGLEDTHLLTSQELHENDWDDFDAKTLRYLLEATKHFLYERYVKPDETRVRKKEISAFKAQAKLSKNPQEKN